MTDLKTDEEKAEELKKWWRDNGTSVLAGVALAVAGTFGWQQWQAHKVTQSETASDLLAKINNGTADRASAIAQLETDFSSTPYAAFASLEKAKDAASNKDNKGSIEALRTASNSSQTNVARIAKLRLIRTLIADEKLAEADTLLSEKLPSAYTSLHEELKGDLYLAKKEIDKARQSYDRAILSAGRESVEYLKMKRNNLGEGA
ncbi:MAG TPA: tetratricopeptide repeat protein [Leucothrix mucor]|nr:tetratricopeptide repeat protein [Leucothrix mucor]